MRKIFDNLFNMKSNFMGLVADCLEDPLGSVDSIVNDPEFIKFVKPWNVDLHRSFGGMAIDFIELAATKHKKGYIGIDIYEENGGWRGADEFYMLWISENKFKEFSYCIEIVFGMEFVEHDIEDYLYMEYIDNGDIKDQDLSPEALKYVRTILKDHL